METATKLKPAEIKALLEERAKITTFLTPPPAPPKSEYQLRKEAWEAAARQRRAQIDAVLQPVFFKKPKGEGPQRELKYGVSAMLLQKIERKVDPAALADVLSRCPDGTEDAVIKWVPELDLTAYRNLSDKTRKIFDEALISVPKPDKFDLVPVGGEFADDEE